MSFNRSKHLVLIALTSAGLLFAGCQKKVEVASDKVITPTVHKVHKSAAKSSEGSVYFAFDKSDLDDSAKATLDAKAAWFTDHAGKKAVIEGNCDERGSREYNLALGQRRADSIRDYLVSRGVDSNCLEAVSFGEERPVCRSSGEACWAQNRRGDIVTH